MNEISVASKKSTATFTPHLVTTSIICICKSMEQMIYNLLVIIIMSMVAYWQHTANDTIVTVSRMASSQMLCPAALVRTAVLEELNASIIGVTKISELGMLDVTSN
jgi:hypothetical protein